MREAELVAIEAGTAIRGVAREHELGRWCAVAIAVGLGAVRNTWITFVASQGILGRSD